MRQEAFDAWNRHVDERTPELIWAHLRAKSSHNNLKGRVFLSWPWHLVDVFNATQRPEPGTYRLNA